MQNLGFVYNLYRFLILISIVFKVHTFVLAWFIGDPMGQGYFIDYLKS